MDSRDIVLTTGTDAFMEPGKKRKTLAVEKSKRDCFFAERPNLRERLINSSISDVNPTIELGKYQSQKERDHEGELIIAAEHAQLLLDAMLEKLRRQGFDTNNCRLIKDDTDELTKALEQWHTSGDTDIKLPYINFRHYISIYLRRHGDTTRVLVLDTQPARKIDNVISAIHTAIPGAIIDRSITPLQLDFFSCLVFTLRAIKYFIRHGNAIFSNIDKQTLLPDESLKCRNFYLHTTGFMPLLKMVQDRSTIQWLLSEIPDMPASKNGATIKEILDQYVIDRDGKTYNYRSIEKRYKDMDKLWRLFQDNQEEQAEKTKCVSPRRCCTIL